jgi:hypothetical protein
MNRKKKSKSFNEEMNLQYKQHIYSEIQVWVELIENPIEVVQLMHDKFQVMVFELQEYVRVPVLEAILDRNEN